MITGIEVPVPVYVRGRGGGSWEVPEAVPIPGGRDPGGRALRLHQSWWLGIQAVGSTSVISLLWGGRIHLSLGAGERGPSPPAARRLFVWRV